MIRVGVVGAGGMGRVHARQYRRMTDVELRVYDRSGDRTTAYSEEFDCPRESSIDALIANCDAIDVCAPTDAHAEIGLKAIAAGRAVLIEKPLARTWEEGVSLVEAAEKAGVTLMPGHVVRFFPDFAMGHDQVVSGKIGKPAAARTRRGGTAPSGADSWFMDHARSGGVLLDLAVHDFDWLRWTLGEVKNLYARSVGAKRGSGPDYALTTLTFESGAVAHVESTWMDPGGTVTAFEVAGSEGLIQYDSRDAQALRSRTPGVKPDSCWGDANDPYYRQLVAFVDAVQGKAPPTVSGRDGLAALAISLAAIESASTGNVVAPAKI